ncbi:MAG: hypothetical protein KC609_14455, partial [Myxococcales bacterium]|nr:hypothetical protein [Myxococcales bacterium]
MSKPSQENEPDLADQIFERWAREDASAHEREHEAESRPKKRSPLRFLLILVVALPVVLGYRFFKDDLHYYFRGGDTPTDLGDLLKQYQQTRFPVALTGKKRRWKAVKEIDAPPPYLAKLGHNRFVKFRGCLPMRRSKAKETYFFVCRLMPILVKTKQRTDAAGSNIHLTRSANVLIQSRKMRFEDFQGYSLFGGEGRLLKLSRSPRGIKRLVDFYRPVVGPTIADAYLFVDGEKPKDVRSVVIVYGVICLTFLLYL